jgi:hypothetical protein
VPRGCDDERDHLLLRLASTQLPEGIKTKYDYLFSQGKTSGDCGHRVKNYKKIRVLSNSLF